MMKWILAIAAAGAAGWYAQVGGRQVTPEHVQALYRDYASAFDRGDGAAVCKLFSERVHGRFVSTSRSMPVPEQVSKASACAAVDAFLANKARLEAAVGHELFTNIEYTVHSVSIDPDRRTARAEVLIEWRIGTEQGPLLDMRSTQTDVIQRRWGRAEFVQSDGSVSFFR